MKKISKILLFFLVFTLFFALYGCSKRALENVEVKSNSFKSAYEVDEKLDLTGAYVVLTYSGDNKEEIPLTEDMVQGFDTTTTGVKTLTVLFRGVESGPISYRVYNPEDASREITTRARLVLYADEGAGYIDYTVRLSAADLVVKGIEFTLTSERSLGIDEDLSNLTAVSDSFAATYAAKLSSDGKKLKTVVFYEDGRAFTDGSVVIRFRVTGGSNREVRLATITLSDGKKDHYLPIAA